MDTAKLVYVVEAVGSVRDEGEVTICYSTFSNLDAIFSEQDKALAYVKDGLTAILDRYNNGEEFSVFKIMITSLELGEPGSIRMVADYLIEENAWNCVQNLSTTVPGILPNDK